MAERGNKGKAAVAGLVGMLAAVALLWLMDVNFIGWLGMWLAPGAAWLLGLILAAAIGAGLGVLWVNVLAAKAGKLPKPVGGIVYGIACGLLLATLVPIILSAIAGNPSVGLSTGTGFDVFPEAFGAHLVPALPDLGFDPPLASIAERDWWSRDDHAGRLLPFCLAFTLFGLCVDLIGKPGK
jgi:hypothetical protein